MHQTVRFIILVFINEFHKSKQISDQPGNVVVFVLKIKYKPQPDPKDL